MIPADAATQLGARPHYGRNRYRYGDFHAPEGRFTVTFIVGADADCTGWDVHVDCPTYQKAVEFADELATEYPGVFFKIEWDTRKEARHGLLL